MIVEIPAKLLKYKERIVERVDNKTDWNILVELSRVSPVEYGELIYQRNSVALEFMIAMWEGDLESLSELKTKYGMELTNGEPTGGMIREEYLFGDDEILSVILNLGCPHCSRVLGKFDCGNCLWTEVYEELSEFVPRSICCCSTRFGGVIDARPIVLSESYIEIVFDRYNASEYDYIDAVCFLLAHMEWTRKYPFGR